MVRFVHRTLPIAACAVLALAGCGEDKPKDPKPLLNSNAREPDPLRKPGQPKPPDDQQQVMARTDPLDPASLGQQQRQQPQGVPREELQDRIKEAIAKSLPVKGAKMRCPKGLKPKADYKVRCKLKGLQGRSLGITVKVTESDTSGLRYSILPDAPG